MSTLDDKILGEKSHYYCSSSEEEDNGQDSDQINSTDTEQFDYKKTSIIRNEQIREWEGYSVNTGPKGVIKDWQRYKQFEVEKRESQEKEKLELMKKLSLQCRSHLDEELANKNESQTSDQEIDDLLSNPDDPFLKEYMLRRMEEMMEQIGTNCKERPTFGKLISLNSGSEFLQAIDKEKKFVTIICHIYSNDIQECETMNGCLECLAQQYPNVKFCSLEAASAGMSKNFEKSGVPALLVYKGGNLLGNFVRLTDEFGDDFFAVDVEKFLVEHGVLSESLVPKLITTRRSIRESAVDDEEDSE